jgi:hypothetical protein
MQAFSLCVVAMKFSTDHSVVFPLASAFIGNRCSRYWARDFVDWSAKFIAFPLSAVVIAPYISVQSRPVIVVMGFLRAILPFVASFQGSRLGRQLVSNLYLCLDCTWLWMSLHLSNTTTLWIVSHSSSALSLDLQHV